MVVHCQMTNSGWRLEKLGHGEREEDIDHDDVKK